MPATVDNEISTITSVGRSMPTSAIMSEGHGGRGEFEHDADHPRGSESELSSACMNDEFKRSQSDRYDQMKVNGTKLVKSLSYIDYLAEMDGLSISALMKDHAPSGDELYSSRSKHNFTRHHSMSGEIVSSQHEYQVDSDTAPPPKDAIDLWKQVASDIKIGVVNIEMIHDSLDKSKQYYMSSSVCKDFVDDNLCNIVRAILSLCWDDMNSADIRVVVERSIRLALLLVNQDLQKNAHQFAVECKTLEALIPIFDRNEAYYEVNTTSRMDKVLSFQRMRGFYQLSIYINARLHTSLFPGWKLIHRIFVASCQCIAALRNNEDKSHYLFKSRNESKQMMHGVMNHLKKMNKSTIATTEVKYLSAVALDLVDLSQEHAFTDSNAMPTYIAFCKDFIVKLLTAQSSAHKKLGLEMLCDLFCIVNGTRDLSIAYNIKGAGIMSCDGLYTISTSSKDQDGYLIPSSTIRYVRRAKPTKQTFVLIFDQSQEIKRTWTLSEEFSVEPGVREYLDFYVNVPDRMQHDPPSSGWTVTVDGKAPCPMIVPDENYVQVREEHKNLMVDLVHWLVTKNIPQLVLDIDPLLSGPLLVKTMDVFMNGRDFISDHVVNRLSKILPTGHSGLTEEAATAMKLNTIKAAKKGVAKAQNSKSTEPTRQAALKSVDEALDLLATIEQSVRLTPAHSELPITDSNQNTSCYNTNRKELPTDFSSPTSVATSVESYSSGESGMISPLP